jgi:hypothetical protein
VEWAGSNGVATAYEGHVFEETDERCVGGAFGTQRSSASF